MRVCIDPGHPSEVGRGTRGKRVTELAVAWSVAQGLQRRLEAAGVAVRLTKQREDEFVTNRRRAELANAFAADLFVRLHCDALAGSGFAVYYPDRPGTARDGTRGPSQAVLERCRQRAPRFHAALAAALRGALRDRGLHPDTHTAVGAKQGALTGSIHATVPVVLVEMGVLTHPDDEAFLASRSGQDRLIAALDAAIVAALASEKNGHAA